MPGPQMMFPGSDLDWQYDPKEPPSCQVPTDLPPAERHRRATLFDAPGGNGRLSEAEWTRIRTAVAVCQGCPLKEPCLEFALNPRHRVEGVWGGFYFDAPEQRSGASLGRRTPRTPPPPKEPAAARPPGSHRRARSL